MSAYIAQHGTEPFPRYPGRYDVLQSILQLSLIGIQSLEIGP